MLSPLFPAWLIPMLSPVFNVISRAIPSAYRGLAVLLVCLAVTAGVVATIPGLVSDDLVPQAIVLFGIVTAGYTLTKPVETAGVPAVAGVLAALAVFGVASSVVAQSISAPVAVQQGGTLLSQVVLAICNGIIGRLFKRFGWRF